ncbi:MAG TPA: hypothetical protein VGW99_01385 [Chthoniobacterales bacterium]|jgi:hypothetical protein|nr:hypothetical protein [Chthoniobacterales bacterium]
MTPGKLPRQVVPTEYSVRIIPRSLVLANRVSILAYLGLVDKLTSKRELAERDQIINTFRLH